MAADSSAKSLASVPQLVPLGAHQGTPGFAVNRPAVVIGSRSDARIHLQSSTVSNHHALLVVTREGMYVRDLASRTHTLVNGRPVREAALEGGDLLQIGRFTFRYVAPVKSPPAAARAPQAVLDIDGEDIPLPIDGRVILIGRRATCDIALTEASASTTHAVVFEKDSQRYVRDLASRTGTFVNGKKIHQEKLRADDVIRCGETNIAYMVRGGALLDEPPQIDALPALEIPSFDDAAEEIKPAARTVAPQPAPDRSGAAIPFDDSGLDLLSPEESSRIEQSPVEPLAPKAPYDPLADTAYPGSPKAKPKAAGGHLPLELEPLERDDAVSPESAKIEPPKTTPRPEISLDEEDEKDFGLTPLAEASPTVKKPGDTALDTAADADLDEDESAPELSQRELDVVARAPEVVPATPQRPETDAISLDTADEIDLAPQPSADDDNPAAPRRGWRGPPGEGFPEEVAPAGRKKGGRKKSEVKPPRVKTPRGKTKAAAPVVAEVVPEVTPPVVDELPPRRIETNAGEDALVSDEPTPVAPAGVGVASAFMPPSIEAASTLEVDVFDVVDPASRSGSPLVMDAEVIESPAAPSAEAPAAAIEIDLSTARFNDAPAEEETIVDEAPDELGLAPEAAAEYAVPEPIDSGELEFLELEPLENRAPSTAADDLTPDAAPHAPPAAVSRTPVGIERARVEPALADDLPSVPPAESHAPLIVHDDAEPLVVGLADDAGIEQAGVTEEGLSAGDVIEETEPTPESAFAVSTDDEFVPETPLDPLSDTQFARSVDAFADDHTGDLIEVSDVPPDATPPVPEAPPAPQPPSRQPLSDPIMGGAFGGHSSVGAILGLGGIDVNVPPRSTTPPRQPNDMPRQPGVLPAGTPLRGLAPQRPTATPFSPQPVPQGRANFDDDDQVAPVEPLDTPEELGRLRAEAGPDIDQQGPFDDRTRPAAPSPDEPSTRAPDAPIRAPMTLPPRPRRKPARVGFNGEGSAPSVSPFAGASAGPARTIADVLIGGVPNGRSVDVFSTPSPVNEIPPAAPDEAASARPLTTEDLDLDGPGLIDPNHDPAADRTAADLDSAPVAPSLARESAGQRFRPRGQIRPMVPGGNDQPSGQPNSVVNTGPNGVFPFAPPPQTGLAAARRKKYLRLALWLVLATAVLTPVVAYLIYHFTPPPQVTVQAQLRFNGLASASVPTLKNFRQDQDALADDVETYNLAATLLRGGVSPGFLADPRVREKVLDATPAKRWLDNDAERDLMRLRVRSTDPGADRERVRALAVALQTRNKPRQQIVAGLRDDAAQNTARITQLTRQIAGVDIELQAVKARAEAALTDQSLPELEQAAIAAENAARAARADVRELEEQFKRLSSPPATQPAVQPAAALAADTQYQTLLKDLNAATAKASAIKAPSIETSLEARKGLDAAVGQFQAQLDSAQKELPGASPALTAYVASAKQVFDTMRDLTDDLIRRSGRARNRITEFKAKLDAKLEQARQELFKNDPDLVELTNRLAMAERQNNAAEANNMKDSEEAKTLQMTMKLLRTLIAARQEQIPVNPELATTINELQDIIRQDEADAVAARKQIDDILTAAQERFLASAPAADELSEDQKKVAAGLQDKLAAINAARKDFNDKIDAAVAKQAADAEAAKQQVIDIQAQVALREREVLAAAAQQAVAASGAGRDKQLADVGLKLAVARTADTAAAEAAEKANATRRSAEDARASLAANDKQRIDLENQKAALEKEKSIGLASLAGQQEKLKTAIEPSLDQPFISEPTDDLPDVDRRSTYTFAGGGMTFVLLLLPALWCLFKAGHEHSLPLPAEPLGEPTEAYERGSFPAADPHDVPAEEEHAGAV